LTPFYSVAKLDVFIKKEMFHKTEKRDEGGGSAERERVREWSERERVRERSFL
jgi:hypothetical protein